MTDLINKTELESRNNFFEFKSNVQRTFGKTKFSFSYNCVVTSEVKIDFIQ